MEPDDLRLCSRNARLKKALVGRRQLETNRLTRYVERRATLVVVRQFSKFRGHSVKRVV